MVYLFKEPGHFRVIQEGVRFFCIQEVVMTKPMEPVRTRTYSDHHLTYLSALTIAAIVVLWIVTAF